MKKKLVYILAGCLFATGMITSCRQDRSGEYYALISTQTWLYEVMQQNYLFYEDIPAEDGLNFFSKPHEFISHIVSPKDQKNGTKFTHVDSTYATPLTRADHNPSFGFEGAIVRIPDGSEAIRVIYTQADSPAEEAQLKRGDWIIAANGKRIKNTDYSTYISNPKQAYDFTLGAFNGEGFDTLQTVKMPAPRMVANKDLLDNHIITSGSRKACYILYNEFGKDQEQLKSFFAQLGSLSFDDIILDLRYNPGGYVSTSQTLSSMLAPASAMNKPFLKMTYNDKINKTDVLNLDPTSLGTSSPLEYKNLYVITSRNTASASEIVINGLRPYMKGRLFQVGTNTFGKNLAQELFTDERASQIELWMTTCSLSNSEDFGDYFTDGLKTDFDIKEDLLGQLGNLGTEQDSLLLPILHHMANGSFPTPVPEEQETRSSEKTKVLINSIALKPQLCIIKELNK